VSPLTTHYDGSAELLVTNSFRLLGAMLLRDLLERCEATLNALDAHYDLFELEGDDAEEAAMTQPTPVVAAEAGLADVAPIDWGDELKPTAPPQAASEPAARPPTTAEIEAATKANEAGLKGLTERLAELKADPAAPAESVDTPPAKTASAA